MAKHSCAHYIAFYFEVFAVFNVIYIYIFIYLLNNYLYIFLCVCVDYNMSD